MNFSISFRNARRFAWLGGALLAAAVFVCPAQAQGICGAEVKADVAATLAKATSKQEQLDLQAQLKAKYAYCQQDANQLPSSDPFFIAARQCSAKASYVGNTYFEEMPCCGYDPQRRQFACPVKIKQQGGFGAPPLPGSREYVLHCVANANNVFVPVGVDSVHLANEMFGIRPSWQFAVVAAANDNLQLVQPMSGRTRLARSILSWALEPTSCEDRPYWGNVIDYEIRLDQ
jgi:hypothetical protein